MCVVSNVGDQWSRPGRWDQWPDIVPFPFDPKPMQPTVPTELFTMISRHEYESLKKQVEQMKAELEAARAKDIAEGNADCHMEEKVKVLKAIAKLFDISLTEVFPND